MVWFGSGRHRLYLGMVPAFAGAGRYGGAPEPGDMAGIRAPKVAQSSRSYNPKEVLSSPVFWLLYVLFVMVSASGLMATAQIAPIAKDFDVGNTIVFFGATTLTAALIIDNVANGSARPLFGWRS